MRYGHFIENGLAYEITTPYTPRDWYNMMWNPTYLVCVGQNLNGFSLYQGDDGVVTNLFGKQDYRDALRSVYLRDNESGKIWSAAFRPVNKEPDHFSCIHGLGYTTLESKKYGIKINVRIFVPRKGSVEIWAVTILNESNKTRNISLFNVSEIKIDGVNMSFGYFSGVDGYCDKKKNRLIFRNRAINVIDKKFSGFTYTDVPFDHFDISRDLFLGQTKSFSAPESIYNGKLNDSNASAENMVSALQYNLILNSKESKRINLVTGIVWDENEADKITGLYANSFLIDKEFEEIKSQNFERLGVTKISSPDKSFNTLFNVWLKHQLYLMADWARFYFKGYRDTLQDCAGMSVLNPKQALSMLEKALKHQRSDGFCPRAFRVPSMDVAAADKHYADSPLWISHATDAILRETGDLSILNRVVPYSDKGDATIWEHNLMAIEYLWKDRGMHGLSLIRNGDWNDLMDQVGANGKGEGIWMSIALARALKLVKKIAGWLDDVKTEQVCHERFNEIKKSIEKFGWDKDHFIYAITDNGKRVGDSASKEGRIFLNPQSWAIISGIIDGSKYKNIMKKIEPLMETPVGPVHHWPPYTKYNPDIGSITCVPAGSFTNGNVYCHAASFKIMADYIAGRNDKAFTTFKSILPSDEKSEPYAQANGYIGPKSFRKIKHVSDDPWRTGTVAWSFLNCYDYLLGFKRTLNGVLIDPQIPSDWEEVSYQRMFRGTVFKVNVTRGSSRKISINGIPRSTNFIEVPKAGLGKKTIILDVRVV